VDELKAADKPFQISKRTVWEAWEKVKANKGAPGVDGQTIADFELDLKNNLYRIWNRMSSGSYFPPPVRAVEIEKVHGGGTRILGVPTVDDRIAQTVVAMELEKKVEPIFHPDSYGYRPKRSALDAPSQPSTSSESGLALIGTLAGFRGLRCKAGICSVTAW
jgi:retron-type reverse transcriptase